LCAVLFALAAGVAEDLGIGGHAPDVERPSPDTATEAGTYEAARELHGHMNWVIWSGGKLDEDAVEKAADAAIAATDDPAIAALIERGRDAVLLDRDAMRAHDLFEAAEERLKDRE
jgi:hypothetical protein